MERFLVQCEQWRARQVGVSVVRELYGVMAADGVAGALGRNIALMDGREFAAVLEQR